MPPKPTSQEAQNPLVSPFLIISILIGPTGAARLIPRIICFIAIKNHSTNTASFLTCPIVAYIYRLEFYNLEAAFS